MCARPLHSGFAANDVPITRICGEIEADLRRMLGNVEIAAHRRKPADISM